MKTLILKDRLREGLSVVERVVSKSSSLPALHSILLQTDKSFLELSATDLEVGVKYRVLTKNEEEGRVAIPARSLASFASLLPEPHVQITSDKGGLGIVCGEYKTIIKTTDAEEFPIIPAVKNENQKAEVETRLLMRALSQVSLLTGQSHARPEIGGVFFLFKGKEVRVVGTDSFRLGEKIVPLAKEVETETSFILPQKAAKEAAGILGDRDGMVSVYFSPNQVVFEYKAEDDPSQTHIQIISRLVEGEYPNYQQIIPTAYSTSIVADRAELANQVKAASVFASRLNDVRLVMDPDRKGVEVSSQSSEAGEYSSFLPCEIKGDWAEAKFNWRFLGDGLGQFSSKEIRLGMGSPEGPGVLMSHGTEEGYVYLIMPIRS